MKKIFNKTKPIIYIYICILNLSFATEIKGYDVEFSANLECGYYDNRALYATFGYEKQLFMCKEGIIGADVNFKNNWSFKGEFAPLYYSLKNEDSRVNSDNDRPYKELVVENDDFVAVDGSTKYVDWYKNMGDRFYNIGSEMPFRELYLQYKTEHNSFKFGRYINVLSFSNDEMIWGDNSWFAPMSYFFSKDLYNGITWTYSNYIDLSLELTSGDGNPTKSHIYYLENEGNSNLKSNNTPTIAVNASFDYGMGRFFAGWERGRIGSVYSGTLKEGKHNKEITAIGGDFKVWNLRLFGQYTIFKTGLRAAHEEDITDPTELDIFGNIEQKGYFLGFDYTWDKVKFGFTYEIFDRYDFRAKLYDKCMPNEDSGGDASPPVGEENVGGCSYKGELANNGNTYMRTSLDDYKGAKQKSYLFSILYQVNNNVSWQFDYAKIKNPLYWVSNILKEQGEDKMRLVFKVSF